MYPAEQIAQMSEMGLMGINVPGDFGGAEMSALAYAVSCEEISRGCASAGVIMSAHNSLYIAPIVNWGNDAQKEKWVMPWAAEGKIGCFGLSEPGNGSDAGAASTTGTSQTITRGITTKKSLSPNALKFDFYRNTPICRFFKLTYRFSNQS